MTPSRASRTSCSHSRARARARASRGPAAVACPNARRKSSAVTGARGASTTGMASPRSRQRAASRGWSPKNGYDSMGTPW